MTHPSLLSVGTRRPRRHKFVVRTVRDGRVRIFGKTYAPSEQHKAYDGRLDGLRYAFGRYDERVHAVALWGTEEAFVATRRNAPQEAQDEYERSGFYGPELVDNAFPWNWWPEVTE